MHAHTSSKRAQHIERRASMRQRGTNKEGRLREQTLRRLCTTRIILFHRESHRLRIRIDEPVNVSAGFELDIWMREIIEHLAGIAAPCNGSTSTTARTYSARDTRHAAVVTTRQGWVLRCCGETQDDPRTTADAPHTRHMSQEGILRDRPTDAIRTAKGRVSLAAVSRLLIS